MDKVKEHTSVEIFRYEVADGVSEYHAMLHVTSSTLPYADQVVLLLTAYRDLLNHRLPNAKPIFRRFFLSDAANQETLLRSVMEEMELNSCCATSVVEQPPLDGSKIALWVYLHSNVVVTAVNAMFYEVKHSAYRHLWSGSNHYNAGNSELQTFRLLTDYVEGLKTEGCTLADHCIRTWFFVQNVDVNYAGVVQGRNDIFRTQGLTSETHFIASTGIAGRHADREVLVQMDAYAVDGLKSEQICYLYAPTHLNPTYEYGVSFERGTAVTYGDRRHIFISGTASINNRGEVVHVGDIRRQTERMWENVEMLLREGECDFSHVAHLLVYLRDGADYRVVKEMFDARFPDIPKLFLLAPVCRPGWLIEMECMAVRQMDDSRYPDY